MFNLFVFAIITKVYSILDDQAIRVPSNFLAGKLRKLEFLYIIIFRSSFLKLKGLLEVHQVSLKTFFEENH